jgi:hypothetical protein
MKLQYFIYNTENTSSSYEDAHYTHDLYGSTPLSLSIILIASCFSSWDSMNLYRTTMMNRENMSLQLSLLYSVSVECSSNPIAMRYPIRSMHEVMASAFTLGRMLMRLTCLSPVNSSTWSIILDLRNVSGKIIILYLWDTRSGQGMNYSWNDPMLPSTLLSLIASAIKLLIYSCLPYWPCNCFYISKVRTLLI